MSAKTLSEEFTRLRAASKMLRAFVHGPDTGEFESAVSFSQVHEPRLSPPFRDASGASNRKRPKTMAAVVHRIAFIAPSQRRRTCTLLNMTDDMVIVEC